MMKGGVTIKYYKYLYRILIIFLLILFVFKGQVFGVRKTELDIELSSFVYDSVTGVHLDDTAKSLQKSYGYGYSEIRDTMTFDTKIKITKASKKKYTIQIRYRG